MQDTSTDVPGPVDHVVVEVPADEAAFSDRRDDCRDRREDRRDRR
jgi:hypothetical protein